MNDTEFGKLRDKVMPVIVAMRKGKDANDEEKALLKSVLVKNKEGKLVLNDNTKKDMKAFFEERNARPCERGAIGKLFNLTKLQEGLLGDYVLTNKYASQVKGLVIRTVLARIETDMEYAKSQNTKVLDFAAGDRAEREAVKKALDEDRAKRKKDREESKKTREAEAKKRKEERKNRDAEREKELKEKLEKIQARKKE